MKRNKKLWINVDVDRTLTKETCWDEQAMIDAEPNLEVVNWVRERYSEYHHICIYTARQHKYYDATVTWLKKHDIPFTYIVMEKTPCDFYIDDKSLNPLDKNWKKTFDNLIK